MYASAYERANPRGVCPEGWHVLTKKNFEELFKYVGGAEKANQALRSTTGWEYDDVDYCGDDTYGFSLLPRERAEQDSPLWTSSMASSHPSENAVFVISTISDRLSFSFTLTSLSSILFAV
ncbi:FISUMP domain-containing protein [uncultured Fibrobacter sp.]|uniref:FISUMP domain-containing protein n=1 Tax=uncultured Fibrobacter sp. TaxID=261512 RepID=UPI0025E1CAB6|nr:FISUMP domain-containing protein [uncultured Fibrobacter sp.]